jgi:ABC-type lipoprotein release transport system permease subunit
MIGIISGKYALRSLRRRPKRTLISVVGVGIGCAVGLVAVAYYAGAAEMQVRAASESGAGHLRVVPGDWPRTRENSLRLAEWREALAAVRATPAVKSIAVRARASGLLAFGNRTAGVEVVGVRPGSERACNRIVAKSRLEGRYLRDGDAEAVVIGKALARRLDVELDDDLLVTLSGRDEMRSAMLRIVGLLATGSREIDSALCHVTLDGLNGITGHESPGEIAVLLGDHRLIAPARADLAARLPAGAAVVTWKQVSPALAANVEGDTAFINFISFIIVVVVVLGITSAQLTAVLERRREMGILTALGMKGRHVVALILLEAAMTGLAGAAAALLMGGPLAYLIATRGINIAALTGGELAVEGVLFDPYVYGDFGVWIVWYALGVSVAATTIAAVYPAWFALKTDPAKALRVV